MKISINNLKESKKAARILVGKIICRRLEKSILKARIVETEAYFDEKDPASRACQNGDLKKTMEMCAGTILVYGVHNNWLLNIVTGKEGKAEAVLIRAVEPINFKAKTSGPGLLTKALKIDKSFHKKNIFNCEELWIENCNKRFELCEGFRLGIKKDLPERLRFYVKGSSFVSKK